MLSKVLSQIHFSDQLLKWTTGTALFLFLGVFLGVIVFIFRKESKTLYTEIEQLPLMDEATRLLDPRKGAQT